MTNANDARRAHEVLDGLSAGRVLSRENEQLLRSFLPELPKQMTLAELIAHVDDAWSVASDNDWGGNSYNREITLESWMGELYVQLRGLANSEPAKPTHPEFLETEADYQKAPEGTIVACEDSSPWYKSGPEWSSVDFCGVKDDKGMSRARRRVLRWSE